MACLINLLNNGVDGVNGVYGVDGVFDNLPSYLANFSLDPKLLNFEAKKYNFFS